ncbi:uncharacterized protein LOC105216398 [Zeugodacus cucurbitae]|nr:uncharacterized protein LOC105216398 [Zeugodacus cucurbitae]
MGVRVFNCCAVLLALFYICFGAIDAAAINGGPRSASALTPASENVHALRVARQAYSDEDDSEEEDDVQAQNFAQHQQQFPDDSQEDSDEDDADDDGDDDGRRRRRRDTQAAEAEKPELVETVAVPEPLSAPAMNAPTAALDKEPEQNAEAGAPTVAATPNAPSRNTSVLILIRDALKKVTTLPTEQVATNALQYFQLFEHFIQQTIENVIGDDDDDEDEAAAGGTAATTIKPDSIFTPEEEEIIAGVEEILKEPELVNKQPQEPAKPAEEVENVVAETIPAPSASNPALVAEEKPATAAEPAASAA